MFLGNYIDPRSLYMVTLYLFIYIYVQVAPQIFYCEFSITIHGNIWFLDHLFPNIAYIQRVSQNLFEYTLK
jgi:hypothetical protein